MKWRAIWAVARKDILIVRRSPAMLYPVIVIPALLLVMLPLGVTLVATSTDVASGIIDQISFIIDRMPDSMRSTLESRDTDAERLIILGNVYFLASFYLLVPLLVSAVIAADTFAGEKERRTLEALLYTPMSDRELLAGKLLAAWVPAITISLVGFVLFGLVVNLTARPVMGEIFFPTGMWLLLVFWVGPAVAGLGLGTMVIISSRVETLQEASQIGGAVVLPLVLIIVGQATGVIYFSTLLVAVLGLVLWAINIGLLWFSMRRFRREALL